MNYFELREQLNSLVNVEALLNYYGVEQIKKLPNEIRCRCILHNGNNPTSFRFNYKTGRWVCFSSGCGGGYRKDLFRFVALAERKINKRKLSKREVFGILLQFSDVSIQLDDIDYTPKKEVVDAYKNKGWALSENKFISKKYSQIDEKDLKKFQQNAPLYFYQRGYSTFLAKTFEIGFSPSGLNEINAVLELDFPGRIIIPIRDYEGKLVGLSGRLATNDKEIIEKYGKYRHTYNLDRRNVLYNLHLAKPYIQKENKVILVEGFFDIINLWQVGVRNVVATLGTKVNKEQLFLLLPYCSEVYLMFDGDESGKEAMYKTYKMACKYFSTYYVEMPDGLDPGDLNLDQFNNILAKADK